MLWSHRFNIGSWRWLFKLQGIKKLDVRTSGFSSGIPNTSLHIIPLDYDNIVDERLIEELEFLQYEFEIGNFHVLLTRYEGRHAVCIDALTFRDVMNIVWFSSCDLMFKRAPRINEFRCWVPIR